jgi:hypothetical protein
MQEPKRTTLAMAQDPERALLLAPTFQPDVDLVVSEGVITFGAKGSGKSNLVARIVEQLRRFHLPQLILDTEGEQSSLLELLPHGVLASAHRCPSGKDIIEKGLQVVLDLRSWDTDEAAALAVCQIIDELFAVVKNISPEDRHPCIIHLDEAAYWLPQDSVTYLSKETRKTIADSFHKLASRGRKYGLTPFLYTQSISEIRKETIRQAGIQVLMRQTMDVDLDRYCAMIYGATSKTRAAIRAYPHGKAVVLLPDGGQPRVQFYERETPHVSHTPTTQTAVKKFARAVLDVEDIQMHDLSESTREMQAPAPKAVKTEKPTSRTSKGPSTLKAWVFSLLEADPALSSQRLATITQRPTNTVQQYRAEYFVQHPDRKVPVMPVQRLPQGKAASTIQALLARDPNLTPCQLHKHVNVSLTRVKQIYHQIKDAQPVEVH